MDIAPLIMLIVLLVAVAVVALFLITVIYVLHVVSNRLGKILGAVGLVVDKTEGLQPIIREISDDLAAGQSTIEAAVARLKIRKGLHDDAQPQPQPQPQPIAATPPAYVPPSGFSNY